MTTENGRSDYPSGPRRHVAPRPGRRPGVLGDVAARKRERAARKRELHRMKLTDAQLTEAQNLAEEYKAEYVTPFN